MRLDDLLARYGGFAINLGVDLVAIFVMTYVLYFRRHWRSDLLLSFLILNVGIFAVMSLLSLVRIDLAVGFGLFAILSIVRLRSSAVTQQEVAYYFVALVLGLINGLNIEDRALVITLDVLLVLIMAVFDSRTVRDRARRVEVRLDRLYTDDAELVAELERRLDGRVVYQEVTEVNLGNGHMVVDVRLRPAAQGGVPRGGATAAPHGAEAANVSTGAPGADASADGRVYGGRHDARSHPAD